MKKITLLLLVLICVFFSFNVSVLAADPPIPSPTSEFYVLDQANVLDQTVEQTIVRTSAALAQKTRAQVVVVTVDSLKDFAPEEYALAILRKWGIGDKELNNGVLILVSPKERVSRIEVGYGLEGALPDGKTGRIQDEYMIPYFQQNDFNQGILNGYLAITKEVANEYKVTLETREPQTITPTTTADRSTSLPWWANLLIVIGVVVLLILDNRFFGGFFTGMIIGMLLRGGGRRGGGGGGGFGGFGGGGGGGGSSRRW